MAVALVIFARWDPMRCFCAALLFGAAGAHRPGAAVGRHHAGLLLLQRRALHPDALHHDRLVLAQARAIAGAPGELAHHASEGAGTADHERTGRPEQVRQRRRHRPRAAATARRRHAGRPRRADRSASSRWSARRGATWRRWTSWCSPNTRCTACRWTPTPPSCAGWTGPRSRPSRRPASSNRIWGCFSIMEFNPGGNP